ncbi:hypothetical protein [Bosea rubneri]|uniref:Uncharacterized protein n=1 Tax=Bosea rubneri TaxID=3075434 RepID=A0ABU3SDY0_9HYPH|nr:hypothetical protein [Bosea sp. ZW T0_25]MDU0342991.1 hypothetical protein [Bosea sp. ZW T0_25]
MRVDDFGDRHLLRMQPTHGRGLLARGYLARLTTAQRCSATGCRDVRVRGCTVCRRHGGGRIVVQRVREHLARARSPKVIVRLVARLDKAERNRVRAYRGDVRRKEHEARSSEADRLQIEAKALAEIGLLDIAQLRRAQAAAETLRPYREPDCRIAAARFMALLRRDPSWAFDSFASELSLDGRERDQAAALLGQVVGAAVMARAQGRSYPVRKPVSETSDW